MNSNNMLWAFWEESSGGWTSPLRFAPNLPAISIRVCVRRVSIGLPYVPWALGCLIDPDYTGMVDPNGVPIVGMPVLVDAFVSGELEYRSAEEATRKMREWIEAIIHHDLPYLVRCLEADLRLGGIETVPQLFRIKNVSAVEHEMTDTVIACWEQQYISN